MDRTESTPDYGYEPWARAAVERGDRLTVEMGRELIETIDSLRTRIKELEGRQQRAVLALVEYQTGRA